MSSKDVFRCLRCEAEFDNPGKCPECGGGVEKFDPLDNKIGGFLWMGGSNEEHETEDGREEKGRTRE